MNLGFEIQKTDVKIKIRTPKIPCVPILQQNGQLWHFWPKFVQKWILGKKFRKLMLEYESASSRYHLCQQLSKKDNFEFFGPNLPQNRFWGRNFKNLSLNSESAPPIYHVSKFSLKIKNFRFFGLNLAKSPNYGQYFDSNNESVAESWVEANMSWVEVGGAGCSLESAGWRWVHGLVIPLIFIFSNVVLNMVLNVVLNLVLNSSSSQCF